MTFVYRYARPSQEPTFFDVTPRWKLIASGTFVDDDYTTRMKVSHSRLQTLISLLTVAYTGHKIAQQTQHFVDHRNSERCLLLRWVQWVQWVHFELQIEAGKYSFSGTSTDVARYTVD